MNTSTSRADYTWKGPYNRRLCPVPPTFRDPILSDGPSTHLHKGTKNAKTDFITSAQTRYIPPQKYEVDPLLLYPGHLEYMPSKCCVSTYQFDFCKKSEATRTVKCPVFPPQWCRGESEYLHSYFSPCMRQALFSDTRMPPFTDPGDPRPSEKVIDLMDYNRTPDSTYKGEICALGCDLLTKYYGGSCCCCSAVQA